MGGRGSGRQSGMGLLADKCHEYHSIDLAVLRRKGGCGLGASETSRGHALEIKQDRSNTASNPTGYGSPIARGLVGVSGVMSMR